MQRIERSIGTGAISLCLCAAALLALGAPALGDESFDVGWLTGIRDGWGNKKATAAVGSGSSVVYSDECVYFTCESLFADESHFHNATCQFSMGITEGARSFGTCYWGYQTGTWETKTKRDKKTMCIRVDRLTPGVHQLDVKISVYLSGSSKEKTGRFTLTVK